MHQPFLIDRLPMPVGQVHRRGEDEIAGFERWIERTGDTEADELLGAFTDHGFDAVLGGVRIASSRNRHEIEPAQEPRLARHAGDDGDGLSAHESLGSSDCAYT